MIVITLGAAYLSYPYVLVAWRFSGTAARQGWSPVVESEVRYFLSLNPWVSNRAFGRYVLSDDPRIRRHAMCRDNYFDEFAVRGRIGDSVYVCSVNLDPRLCTRLRTVVESKDEAAVRLKALETLLASHCDLRQLKWKTITRETDPEFGRVALRVIGAEFVFTASEEAELLLLSAQASSDPAIVEEATEFLKLGRVNR